MSTGIHKKLIWDKLILPAGQLNKDGISQVSDGINLWLLHICHVGNGTNIFFNSPIHGNANDLVLRVGYASGPKP